MLITISEYRKKHFSEKSKPDARTVRKWINQGKIKGKKIDKTYYVDVQPFNPQA